MLWRTVSGGTGPSQSRSRSRHQQPKQSSSSGSVGSSRRCSRGTSQPQPLQPATSSPLRPSRRGEGDGNGPVERAGRGGVRPSIGDCGRGVLAPVDDGSCCAPPDIAGGRPRGAWLALRCCDCCDCCCEEWRELGRLPLACGGSMVRSRPSRSNTGIGAGAGAAGGAGRRAADCCSRTAVAATVAGGR